MGAYRAVVFDLGGVVLESHAGGFRALEREFGAEPDSLSGLIASSGDNGAWARLERGELTVERFALLFESEARTAGLRLDPYRVLAALPITPRPAMLAALRHLRTQGLAIGAITNGVRALPIDSALRGAFDLVVESSVEGIRKPDPRIYELAVERLEVVPAACIYLDDLGANLKPARAMGMTTLKVEDPLAALAALGCLLGDAALGKKREGSVAA